MEDLKKELASLRLADRARDARRWVVIVLLVFMVAAGTIFGWAHGVFAATEVERRRRSERLRARRVESLPAAAAAAAARSGCRSASPRWPPSRIPTSLPSWLTQRTTTMRPGGSV